MSLANIWMIWVVIFSLTAVYMLQFIRRVSRSFRKVARRAQRRNVRRVKRAFRRVGKKIRRVQRRMARTDPRIYQAIEAASAKHVKEELDIREKKRIKEKDLKKVVKTKVAIEIEDQIQKSPMREMRPLIDKTIEATIDLGLLEEISKRPDQIRIDQVSTKRKLVWRAIVPLSTAVLIGSISYIYPDRILPGSIFDEDVQLPSTGGNPPPIDPMDAILPTVTNMVVYGIGTLVLVGLIIYLKRRK